MKKMLSLCCLFMGSMFIAIGLQAQNFVIDEVKAKDFRGVYEIEGIGYYACYKQKGDYQLELLDYDLKPIKKVPLMGIKVEGYLHSASNGKAIVFVHFNMGKDKREAVVYDNNLEKRGFAKIENDLLDVLPTGDKGFAIVTQKGSKNKVTYYDNNLAQLREIEFEKGISIPCSNIEYMAMVAATTDLSAQLGLSEMGGYITSNSFQQDLENKIVAWEYETKGFKPISSTLHLFDTKGIEKGSYFFDHKKESPAFGYSFGNELRLMVYTGNFENKKNYKIDGLYTYIFDDQCQIKEKIKQDYEPDVDFDSRSSLLKMALPVDINLGKDKHVLTQTSLNGSHFEFLAFDMEGHFLGSNKVNKILPKNLKETKSFNLVGYSLKTYDTSKYCHSSFNESEDRFYAIYYNREGEKISFHVSYADQKGISPSKTEMMYEEEVGEDEKEVIKINYFNVFKAEPGKAVIAFYSTKKKSILLTKFDVDALTKKGDGTKKQ